MAKVPPPWDPTALFQALFDRWPDLLDQSRRLRTKDPADPMTLRAAVIGFAQFHPIQEWGRTNFASIDGYLGGEPPLDLFSPGPECAEAHQVFGCLALGALMGKCQAGEISDAEAGKAEWHLMAFLSLHSRDICDGYKVAEQTWHNGPV